jgi:protein-disulfide isomerase
MLKKMDRSLIAFLVAGACIAAVFGARYWKQSTAPKVFGIEQRSKGDLSAKTHITEYFDYQCPPCAMANKMFKERMAERPGSYHLEVRYFPLPGHRNAMKAAIHAECAARQGRFWDFHDKLFENQNEWANDSYAELKYLGYAKDLNLDLARWDACVKDPKTEAFVAKEKEQGQALGAQITPSFFVNGKLIVGNFPLIEELKQIEFKEDNPS